MAFAFRMSDATIWEIIYETCAAIWNKLQEGHMPFPTEELLTKNEKAFNEKWNFPNFIGCIDGKHIWIRCLAESGCFLRLQTVFFYCLTSSSIC